MEAGQQVADFENILLQDASMPLNLWYGDPLTQHQSEQLLELSLGSKKQALLKGDDCFPFQIREIIAHFFLGSNIHIEYKTLVHSIQDQQQIALTELVFGQLLMSKKLDGAMQHLDEGFHGAQEFINSKDYFTVTKRHELLRKLKPVTTPLEPKTLASLLVEAEIIKKFEKSNGIDNIYVKNPEDTLG